MLKKFGLLVLLLSLLMTIVACSSGSGEKNTNATNNEGKTGNTTLKVSLPDVPPTLDVQTTGSYMTMAIAEAIYEPLVTFNDKFQPKPMLADSWDVGKDNKKFTFHLRKGIKFHNGDEMKADDVTASMNRWLKINDTAKRILGDGKFESKDDYTVVLKLKKPSFVALNILASPAQFAAIMPEDIVKDAGSKPVEKFIGTGPYKVKDYEADKHLDVVKFKDYKPRSEKPNGLSGKKQALANEVDYDFVTDDSTRFNSLISGEYNITTELPFDNYDQLKSDPNVKPYIEKGGSDFIIFNKKKGFFSNKTARQAILAGINDKDIGLGTYTDEKFFELNPSLMLPKQKDWYNEEGKDLYNQNNPKKGKKLLKKAGYKGQEITIITSNISHHRDTAIGLQQQLKKKLGMKVKVKTFDFATVLKYREDPSNWDIFIVDLSSQPIPSTYLFFNPTWAGWTDDPKIQDILDGIQRADNQKEATQLAKDLQKEFYNYVPVIKPADSSWLNATTSNVEGMEFFMKEPIPWNVSVK